jgi:hypothetical protein
MDAVLEHALTYFFDVQQQDTREAIELWADY